MLLKSFASPVNKFTSVYFHSQIISDSGKISELPITYCDSLQFQTFVRVEYRLV